MANILKASAYLKNALANNFFVDPTLFGVTMKGQEGIDDSKAWNDAAQTIYSSGGGKLFMPPGDSLILDTVVLPAAHPRFGEQFGTVSFSGSAGGASSFLAKEGGRVAVGPYTPDGLQQDAPNPRAGSYRDFMVQGDGTVDGQLFIGLVAGGEFENVWSLDGGLRNTIIFGTADCTFINMRIQRWIEDGLLVDYGASGNKFFGGTIQGSRVNHTQTIDGVVSTIKTQSHLHIGGNGATSTGAISVGSSRNSFHCVRHDTAYPEQETMTLIEGGLSTTFTDPIHNNLNLQNFETSICKVVTPRGSATVQKGTKYSGGVLRTSGGGANTRILDHDGSGEPVDFIYTRFENVDVDALRSDSLARIAEL